MSRPYYVIIFATHACPSRLQISSMTVLSGLFSFAFLTLALAWLAAGKDCKTLDGKWYNQLGDEISLKHGDNGTLLGEYRTKYAGEPHSAVLGEYIY